MQLFSPGGTNSWISLGNALKYTDHGWVRVSLEADDAWETPGNSTGVSNVNTAIATTIPLTETDPARGISPDYLRTRLYTPFAQASSLPLDIEKPTDGLCSGEQLSPRYEISYNPKRYMRHPAD